MLKICWHSAGTLGKTLAVFQHMFLSTHFAMQCTTHNCELIWILSECHPAVSVDCIVLPATFQFLSKPWKIFASVCVHTHTHHPCVRVNRFASLNIQQARLNNQNMLRKYATRWAEDHIRFRITACITIVVAMVMQDKLETCISVERSHLQKSTWCS